VSSCPHCGKSFDAPKPEVLGWKYKTEGPTVGLGCGTLLLIGLIVAIFSRPGLDELKSRVSGMSTSIEELKKASDAQTGELRELRKAVEDLRPGVAGPGE
jgi:hypothetical protein